MQKSGGTFTQFQKYMGKGIDVVVAGARGLQTSRPLGRGDTRTQVSAVGTNQVGGLHGN